MPEEHVIPYATVFRMPLRRRAVLKLGLFACLAGLCANGIPTYFVLCLLKSPPCVMRPMLEVAIRGGKSS